MHSSNGMLCESSKAPENALQSLEVAHETHAIGLVASKYRTTSVENIYIRRGNRSSKLCVDGRTSLIIVMKSIASSSCTFLGTSNYVRRASHLTARKTETDVNNTACATSARPPNSPFHPSIHPFHRTIPGYSPRGHAQRDS